VDEPRIVDQHGEFSLWVFDIPDNQADLRVELWRTGSLVREFTYPAYRICTLLAHWKDADEVQPEPTVESLAAHVESLTADVQRWYERAINAEFLVAQMREILRESEAVSHG
jgi:hypothetical protein